MGTIPTHVVAKEAGAKPNTVTRVTQLEAYLGEFTDDRGRKDSRVFLRLPGTDHVWVLQQQISGSNVVTEPNKWLRDGFNKALAAADNEPESV
jgi:hypothetical protein